MELILEARKRKLNLSSMCNEFLKDYLNMPQEEMPKDKLLIKAKLNEAKAKVLEIQQKYDAAAREYYKNNMVQELIGGKLVRKTHD